MRKITLSVAFLLMGGIYMANAQVGIGTPTPAASSMLEIKADDKGVLIPRVALKGTDKFEVATKAMAGIATESESLLVYNTATAGTGATAVTPGFYYWVLADNTASPAVVAHWERVVNQSQLDEIIKDLDLTNILALLKHVYPSNNLDGTAVGNKTDGGGMVFTPGDATATPATVDRIEYVYYDAAAPGGYKRVDMTEIITGIVQEAESKTLILQTTDKSKQFYVSEEYLQTLNATQIAALDSALATTWANGQTASPVVALPTGVYEIDIVNGVVNNIEEIFTTNTTIEITDGSNTLTFNTVEEYIQYIAKKAESKTLILQTTDKSKQFYVSETYLQNPLNTTTLDSALATTWATGQTASPVVPLPVGVYQIDIVNGVVNNIEEIFTTTTSIVINEGSTDEMTFTTVEEYIKYIAQNAETETFIRKVAGTAANTTAGSETPSTPDKYYYFSEKAIKDWLAVAANTDVATMPVTATGVVEIKVLGDVATNFEFLLNQTTTYGDQTSITIKKIIEQLAAEVGGNVHYTVDAIPVGTGESTDQLAIPANSFYYVVKGSDGKDVRVLFTLGDALTTGTAVKTKDTLDGAAIYVYNATTTTNGTDATTTGVALPDGLALPDILSIRMTGVSGTSSVTDVKIVGTKIEFNTGSGTMYNVLPAATYKVIIEFAK